MVLLTGGVQSRELSPTNMRHDEKIARIKIIGTHQYLIFITQSCWKLGSPRVGCKAHPENVATEVRHSLSARGWTSESKVASSTLRGQCGEEFCWPLVQQKSPMACQKSYEPRSHMKPHRAAECKIALAGNQR